MAPLIYFSDDEDDLYVRSSSSSGAANNAQQATSSGAGNSTSSQTDRADPILPGEYNREDYDPDSHSEPTPHSNPGSTTNLLGEIPAVDEALDITPPASPSNRRRTLPSVPRTTRENPLTVWARNHFTNNTAAPYIPRNHRTFRAVTTTYDDRFENSSNTRPDLVARWNLRDLISSIMLSQDSTSARRAMLEDCEASVSDTALPMDRRARSHSAHSLGVPFRELISEPMGQLDVPPLLYELMQCNPYWESLDSEYEHGMEVVEFLIDHWHEDPSRRGRRGTMMGVLREACWRRDESVCGLPNDLDATRHALAGIDSEGNKLFQLLRPMVVPYHPAWKQKAVDYEFALTEYTGTKGPINELDSVKSFKAMILVKDFEEVLRKSTPITPDYSSGSTPRNTYGRFSQGTNQPSTYPHTILKPPTSPPKPTPIFLEFIAAERAWALQIHKHEATLTLTDGPDVTINIPVPDLHSDSPEPADPFVDPWCDPGSNSATTTTTTDTISTSAPLLLSASLRITRPDGFDPYTILFPIKSVRPATYQGACSVSVRPFSANTGFGLSSRYDEEKSAASSRWHPTGFDDPLLLNDGMLIVECEIQLSVDRRSDGVVRALEKARIYWEAMGVGMPGEGVGVGIGREREREKPRERACVMEWEDENVKDEPEPDTVAQLTTTATPPPRTPSPQDNNKVAHANTTTNTPPTSTSVPTSTSSTSSSLPPSSVHQPTPSPVSLSQYLPLPSESNANDPNSASESEWELLTDDGSKHSSGSDSDGDSSEMGGWVKF